MRWCVWWVMHQTSTRLCPFGQGPEASPSSTTSDALARMTPTLNSSVRARAVLVARRDRFDMGHPPAWVNRETSDLYRGKQDAEPAVCRNPLQRNGLSKFTRRPRRLSETF